MHGVSSTDMRNALLKHFNMEELEDLCYELLIDHEAIAGSTKPAKVRNLILYVERHGKSSELEHKVRSLRPQALP